MAAAEAAPRRRCAIYTRKSSEEGLEQDFNSLDAQREACEAFIRSQVAEGWTLVRTAYNDGGYSGGTLDRPALRQLLVDIEAAKVDTVVVYKVDRLTRSLADFAKIVEIFDSHRASFVSVTQQFNTTSSMGRLTLNMLLSFAQFEREVTGERIRDKIAASKRKGLWMGGNIPLGYAARGRTLEIVPEEAETVRVLYRLYLTHGCVRRVKEAADCQGLRTKVHRARGKTGRGGRPFSRGHLYQVLHNPLYAGRIPHKGASYAGQHPAVVDAETWDAVQGMLAAKRPARSARSRGAASPLRGKVFDENGLPLTPSHTVKGGRRYRYYVSRELEPRGEAHAESMGRRGWRLPARELESLVERTVSSLLNDPGGLAEAARRAEVDASLVPDLLDHAHGQREAPLDLVARARVSERELTVEIALDLAPGADPVRLSHVVPVRMVRRGVERKLVLPSARDTWGNGKVDLALVRAVVRGRAWFEALASGRVASIEEIAAAEGVTDRYVARLIPLAFLSPEIVAAILAGTQPADLTAEKLSKGDELPLAWDKQERQLGFLTDREGAA